VRALVKSSAEPGLVLEERPRPQPAPHDVLIAVSHAAICGTDLHIHEWNEWARETMTPPTIIGHEFVGTIVELGDQVDVDEVELAVGMRVAGEGHIVCGHCRNCRAGDGHLCRNTLGVGIHRDGAFAEFVSIPAVNAYPVPDTVPDEIAAILDPLGNAVHTTLSFDLVGEDVLITGAGPIGQMSAAIARHAGARHIVVTDLDPMRLKTAERMGATRAIPAGREALRNAMDELEMVEGFDVALEMSGSPAALADIVEFVNHGAKIALLGLFDASIDVDVNQVILKGLTVKGIYGREMFETWYKAVAMLNSGLDVSPVISRHHDLDDYEAAFDSLFAGEANKIVLDIGVTSGVRPLM